MNRPRLVAALVVVVALVSLVAFALQVEEEPQATIAAAQPLTTTTSEPDFGALVQSGVISTLPPAELELTEEALTRSTSTTSTVASTTTTAPPTTSTEATTATTAPPTTSAPTTAPPTTSPPTTSSGGFVGGAESDFASRINSFRSSNGLSGLQRDSSLNSYARSWAKSMGQDGSLNHSNIGSLLPPWSGAGENIGVGGSVSVIFDALVSSSGHRDNMLGNWTHMGIGVWQDSSGALWTCQVFTR